MTRREQDKMKEKRAKGAARKWRERDQQHHQAYLKKQRCQWRAMFRADVTNMHIPYLLTNRSKQNSFSEVLTFSWLRQWHNLWSIYHRNERAAGACSELQTNAADRFVESLKLDANGKSWVFLLLVAILVKKSWLAIKFHICVPPPRLSPVVGKLDFALQG